MILFVLRHGDAITSPHLPDSERPLSDLGRRQSSSVGRFLRETGVRVDRILCSPLLRARQTAEEVQKEIGTIPLSLSESLTSGSDPAHILGELRTHAHENILLIGHEPHAGKAISLLISGDLRATVSMKTCSLACISMAPLSSEWQGSLVWLVSPEFMMNRSSDR